MNRRRVWIAVIVVGALTVAGAAGWWFLIRDDGSSSETAGSGVVIPQSPSLKMELEEGTLLVENDGNVTMSDVEVRDAAGTVVCAMGVISPGDRQPCQEAGGAPDLIVVGSGPQGQPVEAGLE